MDLKTEVLKAEADKKFAKDLATNVKICSGHIASGYSKPFVLYNGGAPSDMIKSLKGRGLNAYADKGGMGQVWVTL